MTELRIPPASLVGHVPSPPLVGSLLELGRDPLGLLMRGVDLDLAAYRFGPKPAFLLNHPELLRQVFVDAPDDYDKRTANNRVFRLVFGESLVTSDGEHWKRQRRIAAPAFHHQRIKSFAETMRASVDAMLDRWEATLPDGAEVDVDAEMVSLTIDIVSRCLIGEKSTGELADVLRRELVTILDYGMFKMPRPWYPGLWAPTPRNRSFLRGRQAVRDAITRIIHARRESGASSHEDLLAMLMSAVDEETGESMDDTQLRDETITIVLAGYETSTNLLDWTFYALARYPDVRERLEAELTRVLGDRPVVFDDLAGLDLTERILKESMRLYPPSWLMVRRARSSQTLLGQAIPEGALLLLSPYVTHRRAAFFPDPEQFDPARFAADAPKPPKLAYFPFGAGRRTCIGNVFAMVEAKIVLAQICRRFRLSVAPGCVVAPEAKVMLKPRHGLRMTVHRLTRGPARSSRQVASGL